ncbi:MAG: hypothetical protein PHC50_03355 [Candidatus Cloacimonetes bacterium]|nr:hypothetical protein [Candidatus Cloacimonadota bacterium]
MNTIINLLSQNQQFVITALSVVIVWIIGLIWKRQADRTQIAAALTMILDIVQDVANGPDITNAVKKQRAVATIEANLPKKKKNLLLKVFGTIGGAVEFVWKNRKHFGSIITKIKGVF